MPAVEKHSATVKAGTAKKVRSRRMTQAERTALSDERMLDAALKLLQEKGTVEFTLREVGELAGYSRGLAGIRFGSKEGLFAALVEYFLRLWNRDLKTYVGERHGLDAMIAQVDALAHYLLAEPPHLRAMYYVWYNSISSRGAIVEHLARHQVEQRETAKRWVTEGKRDGNIKANVDAESFAVLFWCFVFGLIYQWLVRPNSINVKKAVELYKKTALAEIATRPRKG